MAPDAHRPPDRGVLDRIQIALSRQGFVQEPEPLPASVPALTWAFRDGRMIVDHLVLIDGGAQDLRDAHAAAVAWANGRFSTPRALRMRAPHVLTIGLFPGPVDDALARWIASSPRRALWGGETRHVAAVQPDGAVFMQAAIGSVNRQSVALTGRDELVHLVARAFGGP